ncbi:GNAT family N-acetyltransferase [Catenulispora sp. NF23]|uniref:GNAT family N-acetyltransferase n=1 Tax=Catenulispora pinistramenti TaxID=2705254 RepID=A0ABS5L3V9_9ACTN|nr:GNAT family N-acetyltransferase [Catenulispora pinistramenti]MBS2536806.1 GNAT family N-acetyltransferase [Catenulispora pinistramenti]MBS2553006.1 GNAT family N-acetyltransferase [Catenulispora pinistramenti]
MTLHVRPAAVEDTAAIDDLLTAYAHARRIRLPGVGAALDRLTRPESIPAVVQDAARIVGFGHAWPAGQAVRCFARVHPEHVGRGVGTLLLDDLEHRSHGFGKPVFNVMQPAADDAATGLLIGRGYEIICHVLRMQMSLDRYQPPSAVLPAGVTLGPFRAGHDEARLFDAFRDANPGHPAEEGEWWHDMRDDPAMPHDPTLWFTARRGTEIVGYSLGSRHELDGRTVGYVAEIGVRPPDRGQGIAFAALTATIGAFHRAGLPAATLNVDADNLTGALRLYRKAGMHAVPQSSEWSKRLAD